MWTSLEPASTTVDPGGTTMVRLRIRNTGDVVDEYRVVPVGDPALWVRADPAALKVYPGQTGTVELRFSPPRSPDATAGPNPYGVQIVPTEHPEAATVVEGNLTITPFTEVRAELVPPVTKGRFRGRPVLAVDNLGNTRLTASVTGGDPSDQLGFDIHPSSLQIEPGRAAWVKSSVRPKEVTWFGRKEIRPYALALQRSGTEPLNVEGTYVQRSVFPHWVMATFGLLLALGIAFAIIWFARGPQVTTLATEKAAAAGEKPQELAPPSPSPSASAGPSVSAPPEQEEPKQPEKPQEDEDGGDGGGGGGGDAESEEKAPAKKKEPSATGTFVSDDSGKCLSSTDGLDGTQLVIETCREGSAGQTWKAESDGTFRSQGMCMDVAWGKHDDFTDIQIANCNGQPAQRFEMNEQRALRAVDSGKCVDIFDHQKADGSVAVLWPCNGATNQLWKFNGRLPA
ncbi:ricin-type beta-trefoil lectin domain protein [Streptomyces xinghaiensis]|uniref:ricin-type beta-trefoil lectin domain protein n=1 Tax=Streptomyces xinghaiensis TaxID=1038928 RepID=UPI002E13015F